jgi:hypothetical protein
MLLFRGVESEHLLFCSTHEVLNPSAVTCDLPTIPDAKSQVRLQQKKHQHCEIQKQNRRELLQSGDQRTIRILLGCSFKAVTNTISRSAASDVLTKTSLFFQGLLKSPLKKFSKSISTSIEILLISESASLHSQASGLL